MNDKNFDFFIDLGSSKIRAVAFNKSNKDEKIIVEKNNILLLKKNQLNFFETEKVIEEIIYELEKKTKVYMNNISVMIDTSDALCISLSLSKKNDGKFIDKKDVQYLIQDAKQQILKSYPDISIIHIIISNYKIDNKDYDNLSENVKCKLFSIDIFFICFPKKIIKNVENLFQKNQISINQFLCSSYAKSLNYKEQFPTFEKITFIDIGYEKTSIITYDKEKLKAFNMLSIGGNHITKDISKVLDLNIEDSEIIKINLNRDILFSEKNENEEIFQSNFLVQSIKKNISPELIKKITFARIEEILKLSFNTIEFYEGLNDINKLKIVLTGDGSKILDSNFINIKETVPLFDEIDFLVESGVNICESGLKLSKGLNKHEVVIIPKKIVGTGFFEKLFHFFS
jgi:cell division protein FtsA